jgi:EF-hand calcium-binding domain-containing protein 7
MFDLDSNKRLSKEEMNNYTQISSNEEIDDVTWKSIEDAVKKGFKKNELTRDGFIELNKIEIERDDVDLNDIWTRLDNIGFNKQLKLEQVINNLFSFIVIYLIFFKFYFY